MKVKKVVVGSLIVAIIASVAILATGTGALQERETGVSRGGLAKLLPEDTTLFVSFRDVSDFVKKWNGSPFKKLFEHEGYDQFVKLFDRELRKELRQFCEELGFKLEDFLGLFDGEVALAVSGLTSYPGRIEAKIKEIDNPTWKALGLPDMLFVAEAKSKPKEVSKFIDKIFAKIKEEDEGFTTKTHKVEGVEAILFGKENGQHLYYAQIDTLCVITSTENMLKTLIKNKSNSEVKRLSDSKEFRRAGKSIGASSDLLFYLDAKPLVKILKTAIYGRIQIQENDKAKPWEEITCRVFNDVIGLGNLACLAMSTNLGQENVSLNIFVGTEGKPRGLVKLIAGRKEKMEPPSFVPKDASSFSVSHIDLRSFWEELDDVITLAMKYQEQSGEKVDPLKKVEQLLGFKFKEDVFDQLETEVVAYSLSKSVLDTKEAQKIVLWRVKDEKKMVELIEKITDNKFRQMMANPEEIDSHKVYFFGVEDKQVGLSVIDKRLVFASGSEIVQNFSQRLKKKQDESIADHPDYQALKAKLPKEAMSISFATSASIYEGIEKLKKQAEKGGKVHKGVDLNKLPQREFYEKLFAGILSSIVPKKEGAVIQMAIHYRKK